MFLSVATTFVLFGCLYGVNAGFDNVIERIPANRLHVTPLNQDNALPDHYKEKIEQLPGVASVMISTLISASYRDPQNYLYIAAVGGNAHLDVFGDIPDAQRHARALRALQTGALVGRTLAESYGWKVGDKVTLFTGPDRNQDGSDFMVFDIVGVYDVPGAPELARWFLLNYEYLEQVRVLHKGGVVEMYVDTTDPARNAEVANAIDRRFQGSEAATYTAHERDFQRHNVDRALDMKLVVTSVILASLFALLVLSTNTMMQSVRQRLPEFAVLKTLGYSNTMVTLLVVSEATVLCASAAVLGVAAAAWLFPAVAKAFNAPFEAMPPQVTLIAVLVAILTALISSVLPALRIRRVSVATILSGHY
jgi:putative ABC transport system permease protein